MAQSFLDFDLKQLSTRGIAALALRAARRSQMGLEFPNESIEREIDVALRQVESFASSSAEPSASGRKSTYHQELGPVVAAAAFAALNAARLAEKSKSDDNTSIALTALYSSVFSVANRASPGSAVAAAARMQDAVAVDVAALLDLTKGQADLGDPINLTTLGPLWPGGGPEIDSDSESVPTGETELVFTIHIPAGASNDQIKKEVEELSNLADLLHRSRGGHGLKVDRIEIGEGVLEGVTHD